MMSSVHQRRLITIVGNGSVGATLEKGHKGSLLDTIRSKEEAAQALEQDSNDTYIPALHAGISVIPVIIHVALVESSITVWCVDMVLISCGGEILCCSWKVGAYRENVFGFLRSLNQ